jgi:hypothetical protein
VEIEVIVGVGRRDVDGDGEVGSAAALVDEGGCEKGCQKMLVCNQGVLEGISLRVYSLVRNRNDASQIHKLEPQTEGILEGR